MKKFLVQIIETDSKKVVETLACNSRSEAERIQRGVNINLNDDDYHTEVHETEQ